MQDFITFVYTILPGAVFFLLAFIIIIMALGMVLSKNLVHSAVFMILTFIGVAGIYFLLMADFIAAMQLLVYAGAIAILLTFGVMLTRRGDIRQSNVSNQYRFSGGLVALLIFGMLTYVTAITDFYVPYLSEGVSTVGPIGDLMMSQFVVPFEVAALLLLFAMVGAIIIAKGVKNSR